MNEPSDEQTNGIDNKKKVYSFVLLRFYLDLVDDIELPSPFARLVGKLCENIR